MADEGASSIADPSHSPEPEKTGVASESQKAGSPQVIVLPVVHPDDKRAGLQGSSNVALILSAVLNQSGQQLTELAQVVGKGIDRQLDRAQETIDKLQKDLRDEQVAHARTEERLKAILRKDRQAAFLFSLGGIVLGYGLSDFTNTSGKIFSALGVVLLVVGSWPLLPRLKD